MSKSIRQKCRAIAERFGHMHDKKTASKRMYNEIFADETHFWPAYPADGRACWMIQEKLFELDYHVEFLTWRGKDGQVTVRIKDSWSGERLANSPPNAPKEALVRATYNLLEAGEGG